MYPAPDTLLVEQVAALRRLHDYFFVSMVVSASQLFEADAAQIVISEQLQVICTHFTVLLISQLTHVKALNRRVLHLDHSD